MSRGDAVGQAPARPRFILRTLSTGRFWNQGFLDVDTDGHEVPLPEDARLVGRWFEVKMPFA